MHRSALDSVAPVGVARDPGLVNGRESGAVWRNLNGVPWDLVSLSSTRTRRNACLGPPVFPTEGFAILAVEATITAILTMWHGHQGEEPCMWTHQHIRLIGLLLLLLGTQTLAQSGPGTTRTANESMTASALLMQLEEVFKSSPEGSRIFIANIDIYETLSLSNHVFNHQLWFSNCIFHDGIDILYADHQTLLFSSCVIHPIADGDLPAIVINSSLFEKDLRFNRGTKILGGVEVIESQINGSFEMSECEIRIPLAPDGDLEIEEPYIRPFGLVMDNCTIGISADLSEPLLLNAPIQMASVRIANDCTFRGARVQDSLYGALALGNCDIGGNLNITSLAVSGSVEFQDVTCGTYSDGKVLPGGEHARLPVIPGFFARTRFSYGAFYGGVPLDVDFRLRWLRDNPPELFEPGQYEHLADIYKYLGRYDDARQILVAKRWDTMSRRNLGTASFSWNLLYGVSTGFGYEPWKLLIPTAFFAATGWWLFRWQQGCLVPIEAGVERSDESVGSATQRSVGTRDGSTGRSSAGRSSSYRLPDSYPYGKAGIV